MARIIGFGVFAFALAAAACFIALGQHQTLTAVAAGPTPICGTLVTSTWNAAGSPYQICGAGATIPAGVTVTIDRAGGAVQIQALSSGGMHVSGTLVTSNTSATNTFTFTGPTTTPGSWQGIAADTGGTVNLSNGTINYAQAGVSATSANSVTLASVTISNTTTDAISSYNTPLTITGGAISNSAARGVSTSAGNLSISGLAITTTSTDGINVSDGALTHTLSLTNNTITGAGGYGISAYGGAANPTITGNTITNSGVATKSPAITLPNYTGDLAANVSGDQGSGNGLDAIVVTGTVTGNLPWITPSNSGVNHPLGYLASGPLTIAAGKTMTVPQGGVVKFLSGTLNLNGGALDATDTTGLNAPKFFTTFRDPAAITTCPSVFVSTGCANITNDWSGISITQDSGSGIRGDAAFNNTTIHYSNGNAISISSGATTNPSTTTGFGLVLINSTLDQTGSDELTVSTTPVSVTGGVISNSQARGIYASGGNLTVSGVSLTTIATDAINFSDGALTHTAALTNNTINAAGGYGIYVYGGAPNPIITGNAITNSGMTNKGSAISLPYYVGDLAANVSGDHGSGNFIDAITVAGTVTGNLPWITPSNSGANHPLGYLAIGTINLSPAKTMSVPQGGVVKFASGYLNVNGATVDATDTSGPNSPKLFTTFRDPAAIATCPSVFVSTTCGVITNDWSGILITQDTGTGSRGNAAFNNAIIHYSNGYLISISGGATSNPSTTSGYGLVLINTTLDQAGADGLYATSTPVSVSGGVVSNTSSKGINSSAGNLTVSGVTVANTVSDGISFSDGAVTRTASLTNNIVNAAGGFGIYDYGGAPNPTITGNKITNSGMTNKGSAINLPYYTGDLAVNVSGDHGSGNFIDAITFGGNVTGNLPWITPSNSGADHALGYLAISGVNLSSGKTMTVPQGGVVKFASGYLTVNGATLDATDTSGLNNPKVFTTFRDPAAIATCPSVFVSTTCGILSKDWSGILIGQDSVSGLRGNAAFNNTTLHYVNGSAISINSGANTNPSTTPGYGLVLVNTTLDQTSSDGLYASSTPVYVSGGTISNSGGRGINASASRLTVIGATIHDVSTDGVTFSDGALAQALSITNSTITAAGGFGIYAYGGAPNLTITGNTITNSGVVTKSSAINLPYYAGNLPVGVSGDHGSGNGLDAITFAGTVTGNLPWLTPSNSASDHAFGYLAIGSVVLAPGMTMSVPQGGIVKLVSGSITLNGAILDATDTSVPNNPKLFTSFRDPAALTTCPSVFVSSTCGVLSNDWGGILIGQDSTSGLRGSAAFNNTTIHYIGGNALSISGGATTNPAGIAGFGLVLINSRLDHTSNDALTANSTSVSVSRSTFDTIGGNGATLSTGMNNFVGDTFQNITQNGIVFSGGGPHSVMTSRFTGIGGSSTNNFAIIANTTGATSLTCLSIHDNAGGFESISAGNQISGSNLFHNSGTGRYDLYTASATTARANWWGQAGGPLSGQTGGSGAIDSSSPLSALTPTVSISVTSLNTNANGSVGSGTMTVTLTFNRRMDTTVSPVVTFSPGGHPVTAIGSGTGWQPDGMTWIGTATIDVNTTPGANTINVSGARSCDPEPSTNLMAPATATFTADPTGTAVAVTLAATGVFDTGATLNGTINPSGWTTTGYFQFGTTSGSYPSTTASQPMGNGTSASPITAAVTSLTPFTTYYYRTVAVTANGTAYGAEQSFVTPSILHFPALMNNAYGGYTTTIYLQNKSGSALPTGAITITYYDTSGVQVGTGDSSPALANGAVWSIRQDNGHSFVSGSAGSGRVNTSVPVVAFVNQEITGTDGSSYSALPDPATGSTVLAPAVMYQAYGGYTTGFGITNTGSATTTVTVTYRNPDGSAISTTRSQSLAPNGYWGLYQGETGTPLPAGFHGTATITSSPAQNLAVIVNEVGPGGFLTYTASNSGATTLYAPVVFNNAYGGYSTGMGIQNVSTSTANVTINYAGASVTKSETFTIAPRGFAGIYNGPGNGAGLPAGFAGSAVITSDQPLVAIVNEVIGNQGTSYNMIAAGVPTVHLALVENSINGFNTGFGVENVGTGSATISVVYYDPVTGAQVGTGPTLTLAPGAFAGVYQGPGGDGGVAPGHSATATLTVTNPSGGGKLAVIVNQQSSTSFMSYSGQ